MKLIFLLPLLFFSVISISDEGRLGRESNDYKYTSLGLHFIESEKSGFAVNISLDLPGSFYIVAERKADGVDYKNESYDKVIDSLRIGAHKGVGDLIGTISADRIKIKVKNLFDVFAEVGIKTSDFDGERFEFEGDDTHANIIAGIRFGNSNHWEGKVFLDISKEAIVIDSGNPTCRSLNCPPYDAILSDDSDKKFGIAVIYNIGSKSALILEATSSQILDNSFKIGYQLNLWFNKCIVLKK